MAIVWEGERGHKVENVLSTSMTCTLTANTTLNNYLFVLYSSRGGDGTPSTLSIADSKLNTWVVGKVQYDAPANDYVFVAAARMTNPLVTSDVVTMTFGVALGPGRACTMQEFSSIHPTSPLDESGGANAGSGGAVSVPTNGATDTADELVLLAVTAAGSNTAWTVGTNYNEFTTKAQADGAAIPRVHYGEYRIVSSIGVQTATCTSPAPNTGFTGAVATYRFGLSGPTLIAADDPPMGMGGRGAGW